MAPAAVSVAPTAVAGFRGRQRRAPIAPSDFWRQPACKPGSVQAPGAASPKRLRWPFIWDAHCWTPRATDPGGWAGNGPRRIWSPACARPAPIWFCSRWGLPCQACCQARGALLPHPFTLTRHRSSPGPLECWRFAFCGTFPGVAPAGRYPAPCFHGARTFLCRTGSGPRGLRPSAAAIRPTGPPNKVWNWRGVKGVRSGSRAPAVGECAQPATVVAGPLASCGGVAMLPPPEGGACAPPKDGNGFDRTRSAQAA